MNQVICNERFVIILIDNVILVNVYLGLPCKTESSADYFDNVQHILDKYNVAPVFTQV